MPDITMCRDRFCERAESCYRFTAEPDKIQSYAYFWSSCYYNGWQCYLPNGENEPGNKEK